MYLHDWKETKLEGLKSDFRIDDADLVGVEILLAYYFDNCDEYYGDAVVLFERDGKLWRVDASHCSCMGLEGQWEPEETTIEALEHTLEKGWEFNGFLEPMKKVIRKLKAR